MDPYAIGEEAAVGMHVMLNADVPAGALKTVRKLRRGGEWDPGALAGKAPILKTAARTPIENGVDVE